ncbi:hypothetical protein I302_109204 [Kwoniella bestiolae CBS 10118]|uniref:Major facilitator superfamily (MFS) profile domain-containing protein n=1 Tax=Kwoniella bestiolae CBS 10118 TaxID=1296100 RepID=A0A1B9FV93_9TREE|nr:hypothetical protein I302_08350 [Kwoniella bestiolae CBS 10118]OCF22699.1 hypothetical protein I302_08350 [Kwoniella bestiolae CBS 10118]
MDTSAQFDTHTEAQLDAKFEKRLVRKIDRRIMPLICLAYLLNYIDRTNLGNARTLNNDAKDGSTMNEMLNITGSRYTLVVAIFFVPYIIFEFPSNFLLKWMGPRVMLTRITVLWGIVTMCTAACTTYGGLVACRICLAIAEAGFFPGVIMYLCFWYKPEERGARIAVFLGFVSVSGATGGLIATACSYLNHKGNLHGWQWLYILEGIPAVLFGIVLFFLLPDFPETAKFLNDQEKVFASTRLGPYAPKMSDKHFVGSEIWATIRALDFWLFALTQILITMSVDHCLNAFSYFAPSLIAGFGFKGAAAQALIIPPNCFGFIVIVANSWLSDRRGRRPEHIIGGLALIAIGFILLAIVKSSVGGRYVGILLIACTNSAVAPLLAMRTSTVSGASATAVASAGIAAFANISGITAPFIYNSKTAPHYIPALWVSVGFIFGAITCVCALWYRLGPGAGYTPKAESPISPPVDYSRDVEDFSDGRKDKDLKLTQVTVGQV